MAYIQLHEELPEHPKTKRASRLLGVNRPTMVGHLTFLWNWCLKYAQDGDLTLYEAADIADAAGWEGEASAFVDALLNCGPGESCGFLERDEAGALLVHDWWDYAGKLVEKRRENAERMRRVRAEHVQDTSDTRGDGKVLKPNVAEPSEEKPNVAEPSIPPARGRARGLLAAAIADVCYGKPVPELTDFEQRSVVAVDGQLERVHASPVQVYERGKEYRTRWPNMTLTPEAMAKHWTDLGKPRGPATNGNGRLSAAEIFQSAERKRAIEAQGSVRP